MKRIILYIHLLLLPISAIIAQPLSGPYTINASGSGAFLTISDAVAALYANGISGIVTFTLDGSFNEQIDLNGAITGSSKFNPIIFQNGKITYTAKSPGDNYLVRLNSARFIEFRNNLFIAEGTTYSRIIYSETPNGNITFDNNEFSVSSTTGSDVDKAIVYCKADISTENLTSFKFTNNAFYGGTYGLYLESFSLPESEGLLISGNTFTTAFRGIHIDNFDAPEISSNSITNISNDYAIYVTDCSNDFIIEKNKISTTNSIGSGIKIQNCSIGSDRSLIVNNFIQACDKGISLANSDNVDIFFNSINIEISSNTLRVISASLDLEPNCSSIGLLNNIFVNKRSGYSFDAGTSNGAQILLSDYNDFYTTGPFIIRWNSFNYSTLPWLYDPNSYKVDPVFTSITDLHAASSSIDNKGVSIASVTTDIDGDLRSSLNPSIGADEYFLTLSGFYTIGPSSTINDYNSIEDAVDDLYLSGIDGPVIFQLKDGIYNEQINLDGVITGSSTTNTVTFRSFSYIASNVEITHSASNSTDNFVLRIKEAEHVNIKYLTLTAGGTDFAKVVSLENTTGNLEFINNTFNGYEILSGPISTDRNIIVFNGSGNLNNTIFENNNINNGENGIYLVLSAPNTTNLQFIGNTITSRYNGILVSHVDAPKLISNTIFSKSSSCIYISQCSDDITIQKNYLSGFSGIYLSASSGTVSLPGNISNNFIGVRSRGMRIYGSQYFDINFNSIFINNPTPLNGTIALELKDSFPFTTSNLSIKNNIIYNNLAGYAFNWLDGTNIISDYNNLYSNGVNIGYANGADRAALSDFQTASGTDANSYNAEVTFVSPTDLHIVSYAVSLLGSTIPTITEDIDGNTRGAPPFIGADEPIEREVSVTLILEGSYNVGNMNTALTNSLPLTQPYSSPIHTGSESVSSGFFSTHTNIVDWVAVELRSDINTKVTSRAGFLLDTGEIVDLDGVSPLKFIVESNSYWFVVHHRNHLPIMSSSAKFVN